jgi:D-glycero-D-manno-heptose 1,7-bisphosphate phosphatase
LADPRVSDTVFLDRDGTINVKMPEGRYVERWEDFAFLPGAKAAIRRLNEAGLRVIVVTNQRGIALGRLSEADLAEIHRLMSAELAAAGARVDAIYHCPHDHGECDCRKPGTGMFLQAQVDYPGITFEDSAVVGDSLSDMQAGARLGCRTILIDPTGEVRRTAAAQRVPIDLTVLSLTDAVAALLD